MAMWFYCESYENTQIASQISIPEGAVFTAITYWEQKQRLKLIYVNIMLNCR